MRVLVVYGSKMGATAGLARMVGEAFDRERITAQVARADEVNSVDGYDAVVVGGALYGGRWPAEARRFVKRLAGPLRDRPVYLFSSGPLGDHVAPRSIPPTRPVQRLMRQVQARDHTTFGGALRADAKGLMARLMARRYSGDWRSQDDVDAWVHGIAADLRQPGTPGRGPRH